MTHPPLSLRGFLSPCHCEERSDRSNLGGAGEIAALPPDKPWPACAKALAKASRQVARNDKKGGGRAKM
ncbi:MAG: hypothetical protein ABSF21_00545 [Dehalococcoidia bacterium]